MNGLFRYLFTVPVLVRCRISTYACSDFFFDLAFFFFFFVFPFQIPLYPAAIFQNAMDGEGFNFVLYFRLSESYSKELPSNFLDNIRVRWVGKVLLHFSSKIYFQQYHVNTMTIN